MTHVKHLGFDLELKVARIARALVFVPQEQRLYVIESLAPIKLRRAVADQYGIDL